jgi:UDP-galactopyranose mutase
VSAFFNYAQDKDGGTEIDIEFLGYDTTKVQFNYYTSGVGCHEYLYDLGFDASKAFHTYAFKWAKDSIKWYVDGKLVPMPICIDTLNTLYDLDLDENSMKDWIDEHKEDIDEVKSSEDVVLKNAGRDIYEKLFKNYTEKQWGTSAANLSPTVISRIPFRFNHDDRYFADTYQGMPKEGFTKMCENMIKSDKIHVGLKADYKDYIDRINYETLIYTGPIDYFYDYKYGELLYRCLNFVYEIIDEDSYQDVAVVNHPNDPYFTRITEFKKLTWQEVEGKTAIMKEYPGFNGEKCYPYPTQEYLDKFKLYEAEMEKEENVIFLGRLARYKYYNMDLVVKEALEVFENQIK